MLKRLSELVILITILVSFAVFGHADVINTDKIFVSTISAQTGANNITFTSSVYSSAGGLTLQGAGGVIASQSSFTASAFFGDGRNLTGIAFPSSPTFSGAETFASTFTVNSQGNPISFSTSAVGSAMRLSGAGNISFTPELHNSSAAAVPAYQTTAQYFGTCIDGSTLTIVTSGGRVEASFFGEITAGGGAGISTTTQQLSILQDGQFVVSLSSAIGVLKVVNPDPNHLFDISFNYLLPAPAAGSHSYCLSLAQTSIPPISVAFVPFTNQFFIQEIK